MNEKINLGFKGDENTFYIKDNKVYAYCNKTKWRIVCKDYLKHKNDIDLDAFKKIYL